LSCGNSNPPLLVDAIDLTAVDETTCLPETYGVDTNRWECMTDVVHSIDVVDVLDVVEYE